MKKIFFYFVYTLISIVNVAAQDLTTEQVKEDIYNGIVSFVSSVKEALPGEYGTFDEFKLALIGKDNSETITKEGNELLKTTYDLIKVKASAAEIKEKGWRPFAQASRVVLDYEKDEKKYSGVKLQNGSVYLFGGHGSSILNFDENGVSARAAAGGNCGEHRNCRWYQIGCHLHNVGVWICEHKDLLAGIAYGVTIIYYILQM